MQDCTYNTNTSVITLYWYVTFLWRNDASRSRASEFISSGSRTWVLVYGDHRQAVVGKMCISDLSYYSDQTSSGSVECRHGLSVPSLQTTSWTVTTGNGLSSSTSVSISGPPGPTGPVPVPVPPGPTGPQGLQVTLTTVLRSSFQLMLFTFLRR